MSWPNWTRRRPIHALVLALPVFALLLLLRASGWLEPASLRAYDVFNRWLAQPQRSERTLVIGFSESDFKYVGTYPFPDEVLADVLERVLAGQPEAIYLNILRDIPVEPGHARLLDVYRRAPMLFGFDTAAPGQSAEASAPPVLREAGRFGFSKLLMDADGVNRSALLADVSAEEPHESALLRLLRYVATQRGVQIQLRSDGSLQIGQRSYPNLQQRFGDGAQPWAPTWAVQQIPFVHRAPPEQVSFQEVLEGRVDPSRFAGRTVVIGTTASSMARMSHTPLAAIGARGITSPQWVAQSIDNLYALTFDQWPAQRFLPAPVELAGMLLLAWLACWNFLSVRSLGGWALRAAGWSALLIGGAWLAFRAGWWLPVVPVLSTLALAVALVINNMVRAEASQRQLVSFFGQVLDEVPDPIYVLDDHRCFRLVNAAFARLTFKRPIELLGRSADGLLGPFIATAGTSSGERELQLPGEIQRLQVRESSQLDARNRALRIGIVRAAERRTVPDLQSIGVSAAQLEERFAAAAYWAGQQQLPLVLMVVELSEAGLLETAYGSDCLPQILVALSDRLQRAFPDAVFNQQLATGQFAVLLSRKAVTCARFRELLAQAFSWPLQTRHGPLEVDLRVGCATHGTDGHSFAELQALALSRQEELPMPLTSSPAPPAYPFPS